ncbi:bone morphogenetic protein 10-like [Synchiropus splendidus]|uniref:bone morphogenetic protein 10-like n=1 Tax=Synchiropus splendidus TaxID=270530 RepID=UPI00237ED7BC|nr:bone morphogenetic protein 10-like [Synchiropus splendidus]
MTVSIFFSICFISSLPVVLLILSGLSSSSPIGTADSRRRASVDRDDYPLLDAQDFLNQFLTTLNLTEQRPSSGMELDPTRRETEEYMLELYNRFARDLTSDANIVRSFKNGDSSTSNVKAVSARIFPLLFNISMPRHEHITVAELRLLILVPKAQRRSAGLDCKVAIYKIHMGAEELGRELKRRDNAEEVGLKSVEELMTKYVHTKDNSWVSFDLTREVRRWQKSGSTEVSLEVHVTAQGSPEVDINRNLEGKYNAEIIVFSDDGTREHKYGSRGNEVPDKIQLSRHAPWERADHQLDTQSFMHSNFIYDASPRIRRHAKAEPCRRAPLFVDFKDIGWDTWIVQPLGYEAYRCNGVCSPPMTSEVSPTNHALVQTQLSFKSPERVSPACCVPTKLEPISLLYYDNGVVTFKHKYEGMVVAECGCR